MKLVQTLTVKIFMNLDTALRKSLKKEKGKKKKPTSLRMNEIPAAHLQTAFSSSIQSYYKWVCAQKEVENV